MKIHIEATPREISDFLSLLHGQRAECITEEDWTRDLAGRLSREAEAIIRKRTQKERM